MLKKLAKKLFGGGPSPHRPDGFFLKVRCTACGEEFNLFINRSTDLLQSIHEDDSVTYSLNKEIVGSNCRNLIHVNMEFDGAKKLLSKHIEKGEFLEDQ
jgi:hypothetical protein